MGKAGKNKRLSLSGHRISFRTRYKLLVAAKMAKKKSGVSSRKIEEMAGCCVTGCNNRSEKGYTLKRIPKNPQIRKQWLENVGHKGWTCKPNYVVCEIHFEACMWEKVRVDGKRKLKATAVPTIFPYKRQNNEDKNVENSISVLPETFVSNDNGDDIIIKPETDTSQSVTKDPLSLDTTQNKSDKSNVSLLHELKMYQTALMTYKQHMKQLEFRIHEKSTNVALLKKIFNDDQIELVKDSNFINWSGETIKNALKLYFTCGSKGYQELVSQKIPLPSLEVLKSHLQSVACSAGVLNEMCEYLRVKISTFPCDSYKDCTISLEEVSVLQANIFDTKKSVCIGSVSQALIVTLCGICAEWKQIVAYYFVGSSVNKSEYNNILKQTIMKAEELGLRIISVICNIGEHTLFITDVKNFTVHPVNGTKIFIVPDVSCLFKKIKSAFVSNKIITIPSPFKEQYGLPTDSANFNHVEALKDTLESLDFKLVPTVTQEGLLSADVASDSSTLSSGAYDISNGLKALAHDSDCPEYRTTAWLIDTIEKWFLLMTSKQSISALNKHTLEAYEESIEFLKDFMKFVSSIRLDNGVLWDKLLTDILLATQSVLDIQDLLLNEKNYNFLITSRITQGYIANLVNSSAQNGLVLNAAQLKNRLKIICDWQYFQDVSESDFNENSIESLLIEIRRI